MMSSDNLAKCTIAKNQSEPLIVDWESVNRAKLEALASHGAVPVAYSGCEMKMLAGCSVPNSAYKYVGTTTKHDADHIRSLDDLYAKLPLGAVRLEGTYKAFGELDVDMTIVGRYEQTQSIHKSSLVGDCEGATHIVTALTVGAFSFSGAAGAKVAGEGSGFGASAGGSSDQKRTVLTEDGLPSACEKASPSDKGAPAGCGALIRIELRVIPEVAASVAEEEKKAIEKKIQVENAEQGAHARRVASYVVAGAGVALLAGGLISLNISSSAKSSIDEGKLATGQDIVDADSRARTFQGIAIGGLSAGGAALVVGAILFLTSGQSAPASSPTVGSR